MKKLALTIAIVLGLGMTTFADPNGGGLFQRGTAPDNDIYGNRTTNVPLLPYHDQTENQDADTPLGAGIAVLAALGGAYLVSKKKNEKK